MELKTWRGATGIQKKHRKVGQISFVYDRSAEKYTVELNVKLNTLNATLYG